MTKRKRWVRLGVAIVVGRVNDMVSHRYYPSIAVRNGEKFKETDGYVWLFTDRELKDIPHAERRTMTKGRDPGVPLRRSCPFMGAVIRKWPGCYEECPDTEQCPNKGYREPGASLHDEFEATFGKETNASSK